MAMIHERLARETGETLRAPLLEVLAFLGEGRAEPDVRPLSILNWANYLVELMGGDAERALPHFERFVNTQRGWDDTAAYIGRYHDRTVQRETLIGARRRIAETDPSHSLAPLDALLERLQVQAPAGTSS
jgi:hypothetical protein